MNEHAIPERLPAMLAQVHSERRVMPPIELYNEGWLLRLVLDLLTAQPCPRSPLGIAPATRWYSEALLPSAFLPRWRRGDPLAESPTHADGAVGHFRIGGSGSGDLVLDGDAACFVIVEAKLHSKLSAATEAARGGLRSRARQPSNDKKGQSVR